MQKPVIKPIKGYKAFSNAFYEGRKFRESDVLASIAFSEKLNFENQEIYLGVTISKRTAKLAVVRNRVKRLLRESVRQIINEKFESGDSFPIDKILISWRKAPKHSKLLRLSDVKPVISKIFDKASGYYNKRNDKKINH